VAIPLYPPAAATVLDPVALVSFLLARERLRPALHHDVQAQRRAAVPARRTAAATANDRAARRPLSIAAAALFIASFGRRGRVAAGP